VHHGQVTWHRLDLAALRARLPYPILDIVISQTPDSALPQMPRRREPAALDEGPHLSYAIQWFAFATIAVVFAGIFWNKR
jgi:surfeit locus 1 family protein